MTRSSPFSLLGLLSLVSVAAIGSLPLACQSGGVGDACTPEDEYNPDFAGFKVTEENIESRSFQCSTRICLVNHFQGRVTCPLGQPPLDTTGSPRKTCNGLDDQSTCSGLGACVEASTFAPDCVPPVKAGDPDPCPSGTKCDKGKHVCACISGAPPPLANYHCVKSDPNDKNSLDVLKSYVCHEKSNCQTAGATAANNKDKSGNPKDCCVPGTDTPATSPVCGQCAAKSNRNADNAVYCSCRCGVAEGQNPDPNFNFCTCPTGFTCTEIRKDVGLGDAQLTGKYCIKENSAFTGDALSCGEVQGYFDTTCKGQAAL